MRKLEAAKKLAAQQNEYKEDLLTLCNSLINVEGLPEEVTAIVSKYTSQNET